MSIDNNHAATNVGEFGGSRRDCHGLQSGGRLRMAILRVPLQTPRPRGLAVETSHHSERSMRRLPAAPIRQRTRLCHVADGLASGSCRSRLDGLHKRMNRFQDHSTKRPVRSWRHSCEVHTAEGRPRARLARRYQSGPYESPRRRASTQFVERSPALRLHSGGMRSSSRRVAPGEARAKTSFAARNPPLTGCDPRVIG